MQHLAIALALIAAPAAARPTPPDDWQVLSTPRPVTEVVTRLKARIGAGGGRVVAIVDHAANARATGEPLAETTLVIFGNPKLGTPLIARNRAIALDLPQRMLVWREGGATKVGYLRPAVLGARYAFPADDPAIVAMDKALSGLAAAATAP